ncbi:MAG TPA: DMT family transporter [Candidatus Aquilonibacter sp.]|nr:DMT family transporter [Candidatus Aquilonibacter sp.]
MAPTPSTESPAVAPAPAGADERHPAGLLLGATLALILLLWSVNYTAGKIALRHMGPLTLAPLRIELAAMLMLAVHFSRRGRARFHWRDAWMFAYLGFLGVVLNQGCFMTGLNYTTSERSVLVKAIGPILILLLARAMGLEAFSKAKIGGMALAFLGVVLLETEGSRVGHTSAVVGDAITMVSTLGFAIYSVLGKKVLYTAHAAKYDSISLNTFITAAAGLMLLPLAARQAIVLDWHSVGWAGWSAMIYMAAGSSVAAYTLFYWVLKHLDASRVAAINYVQPILVILLSMLFLGEHPTGHLISGGILVLVGVYFVERVSAGARLEESESPEAG